MILVLILAFCSFVIIVSAIMALKIVTMVNDYNKETYVQDRVKDYDTTIFPDQSTEIAKKLAAYKTNFTYYPTWAAANEVTFIDHKNNDLILKVSKVSCYSDITGIKNHQGYLYSIVKDYVVLKNYTSLDECIRDYQQNYCLFVKKIKIADRLKSLQEDF
jgi:hypothetical protein